MSYVREDNEEKAFKVVRKVVKGRGNLHGVFYLASKGRTGPVGMVFEIFTRDRKGTKTLQRGMRMRKALKKESPPGDVPFLARGVFELREGVLEFKADYRKGNLEVLKRAAWKDLASQPGTPAKKLSKLFRKARFLNVEGEGDDASELPSDGEPPVVSALDGSDLDELDLDGVEIEEALGLEREIAGQLGALEDVLATGGDDDEATLIAALGALKADHERMISTLRGYHPSLIAADDRAEIRAQIAEELAAIGTLLDVGGPLFEDEGSEIKARDGILIDILAAQQRRREAIHGQITMGDEAEFDYRAVHETRLADHTCLFKTDFGVEFHYETQGGKIRSGMDGAIIEAITSPVYVETPEGKALNARHLEAISVLHSVFLDNRAGIEPEELVREMGKRGVVVELVDVPEGMTFGPPHRRGLAAANTAPQVTLTHTLTNFASFMREGYPDVTSTTGRDYRNRVMQYSIAHADETVDHLLEAAGLTAADLPDEAEGGERLRAFLGLLFQEVTAEVVGRTEAIGGRCSFTTAEGEKVNRSVSFKKDLFGVLNKTPLPILAQEGGLGEAELNLLREHKDLLMAELGKVFTEQGLSGEPMRPIIAQRLKLSAYLDRILTKPFGRSSPKIYQDWVDQQVWVWRYMVGDAKTDPILAKDEDGSMRVATEIRQATLGLQEIQDRVLTALDEQERARFEAAGKAVLDPDD